MSTPTMQPHEPFEHRLVPETLPPAAPPIVGVRAVGASRWRVLPLRLGLLALGTAAIFEVVASVWLNTVTLSTARTPPSESTVHWTSWLFNYTPGFITYAYPPALLWMGIGVALIPSAALFLSDVWLLTRSQQAAGLMPRVITGRRRMKLLRPLLPQLRADLTSAGYSSRMLRARGRVWLILGGELGALTTLALSAYTLVSKDTVFTDPSGYAFADVLSLGVGPVICFVASLLLAIALPVAWPRRSDRTVLIRPDGRAVVEQ